MRTAIIEKTPDNGGFIGKKMFDKDFVMSISHRIASRYFPKRDDLLFSDSADAYSLAKRVCINALQRGISVRVLEQFAEKAYSAESFNLQVARYFGYVPDQYHRTRPYITLYRKEREVLKEVFGLSDAEIDDLTWGKMQPHKVEQLYMKIEKEAQLFDEKLSCASNSCDAVLKFLSIRWGLDDGFPKPIRQVGCEMGLSDITNYKIKKLMNEIFDGISKREAK